MSEVEQRIQAAIQSDAVRGREVERIGPFVATFSSETSNPYLNYAIPAPGAAPGGDDVAALVAAYVARDRVPRLEYVPGLAPKVEDTLLAGGFTLEGRLPLMRSVERPEAPTLDGIDVFVATEPDDIRAAVSAQFEAYEEVGEPGDAAVAGTARSIEAGGLLVLARDALTGEAAGAGQVTVPDGGACELTSVGVRPAYRRRGIARAVAALLARTALDRGVELLFLMAHGDTEAERIYARAGFRRIGEVLHISVPDRSTRT